MRDGTREFLICECESLEHLACFYYTKEECIDKGGRPYDLKFVTLSVRLKTLPFFKRLVKGVKYIFGGTSEYGDYDEFILKPKDAIKFKHVANHLEICKE